MPQKYRVKLSDGREIDVETDGGPPSEEDILSSLSEQPKIPVEKKASTIEELNPDLQEKSGVLSKIWHGVTEPLITAPSKFASSIASSIDEPSLERSPAIARLRGFGAGTVQGIGDLISGLSSPLNIALTATGLGEVGALKTGLPGIAKAMSIGTKALSVPTMAEGMEKIYSGETIPEKLMGGLEIAGGIMGMRGRVPSISESISGKRVLPEITRDFASNQLEPKISPKLTFLEDELGPNASLESAASQEAINRQTSMKNRKQQYVVYDRAGNERLIIGPEAVDYNARPGETFGIKSPEGFQVLDNKGGKIPGGIKKPSVRPDIFSETGAMYISSKAKPKYRLDQKTGEFVPLNKEAVNQMSKLPKEESGTIQSAYDLSRGMISVDPPFMTSAAFRQAAPLIGTKAWFKAWVPAAKSYGSEVVHDAINEGIAARPLFKSTTFEGQTIPSYAEQVGFKLRDLKSISRRDEALRGELAEKIPIYGKVVRGSNRAFTSYLNSIGADTFESLINDATKEGLNPMKNLVLGRQIAEFVSTATSRGKLGIEIGKHEINLERNAKLLSNIFFSPSKTASEIRMLNPSTYIMTDPFVRRQYLKAVIRRVGTWWTIAGLAQMAGAEVSKHLTSPDFGKIKIGNTRIDPPGGLQQFLVLGAKIYEGGSTSSVSDKFTPFGKGYKPETRASQMLKFGINRLHPTAKATYDLLSATQKAPFHVEDRILQMAAPMFSDDLMSVAKDNPELAPLILVLSGAGMGTQSYERGSFGKPVFIPEQYDWNIGAR